MELDQDIALRVADPSAPSTPSAGSGTGIENTPPPSTPSTGSGTGSGDSPQGENGGGDKHRKLFDTLVDKMGYSKTYDEFTRIFSDSANQVKLYEGLAERGAVTIERDVWVDRFFGNTPSAPLEGVVPPPEGGQVEPREGSRGAGAGGSWAEETPSAASGTSPEGGQEIPTAPLEGVAPSPGEDTFGGRLGIDPDRSQGGVMQFMNRISESFARPLTVDMLRSFAVSGTELSNALGLTDFKMEESPVYKFADRMSKEVDALFPNDKAYQDSFLATHFPSGLGSAGAFMVGGVAGKTVKVPAVLSSVIIGGGSMGANEYEAAKAAGADDDTAFNAFLLNLPLGATEAIPVGKLFRRLDSVTGGGVKRVLASGFKGGAEEFVQEVFLQAIPSNVIAGQTYDETRRIVDAFYDESGETGFAVGFTLNALGVKAKQMRMNARTPEQIAEVEKVEGLIEELDPSAGSGTAPSTPSAPSAPSAGSGTGSGTEIENTPPASAPSTPSTGSGTGSGTEIENTPPATLEGVTDSPQGENGDVEVVPDVIPVVPDVTFSVDESADVEAQAEQLVNEQVRLEQSLADYEAAGGTDEGVLQNFDAALTDIGARLEALPRGEANTDVADQDDAGMEAPGVAEVAPGEFPSAPSTSSGTEGTGTETENTPPAPLEGVTDSPQGENGGAASADKLLIDPEQIENTEGITARDKNTLGLVNTMSDLKYRGEVLTPIRDEWLQKTGRTIEEFRGLDEVTQAAWMDEWSAYLNDYVERTGFDISAEAAKAKQSASNLSSPDGKKGGENQLGDSWYKEFERIQSENDLEALDLLYNKVKVALNGYAQGKGEATVKAFEELKADIEKYAKDAPPPSAPSTPSTGSGTGSGTEIENTPPPSTSSGDSPQGENKAELPEVLAPYLESIDGKLPAAIDKIFSEDLNGVEWVPPKTKKRTPLKAYEKKNPVAVAISNDNNRPAMTGVFYDAEHKARVATDGYILIHEPDTRIKKSRVVDPKTGKVIKEKFPAWKQVTPDMDGMPYRFDFNQDMIDQVNSNVRFSKFTDAPGKLPYTLVESADDVTVAFDSHLLQRVIRSLQALGAADLEFGFNTPNKAALVVDKKKPERFGLVMPVFIENKNELPWHNYLVKDVEGDPTAPSTGSGTEGTGSETEIKNTPPPSTPSTLSAGSGTGSGTSSGDSPQGENGEEAYAPAQVQMEFARGYRGREASGTETPSVPRQAQDTSPEGGQVEPVSLKDIIDGFVKDAGLTLRQGRIRTRGALGVFKRGDGVIRSKIMKSLDIIAHEAGHDVHERFRPEVNTIIGLHTKEVEAMAYEGVPAKKLKSEGFAEFVRWYITNDAYARDAAPNFYPDFVKWLASHPELQKPMIETQQAYEYWINQPSGAASTSQITMPTNPDGVWKNLRKGKVREAADKIRFLQHKGYTWVFDKFHPIKMAVDTLLDIHYKNTGKLLSLEAIEDAYKLFRLTADAYTSGQIDVEFGVENYLTTEIDSPGLVEALHVAFGKKFTDSNIKEFGAYLADRRIVKEWDRFTEGAIPNPPSKLSKLDHEASIRTKEAKHATFAEAAELIYSWNNAIWQKQYDAGLINDEQYEAGLEAADYYVPLNRDRTDVEASTSSGTGSGSGKDNLASSSIKRFKGSDRDIINPIVSMMRTAYSVNQRIKANDARVALAELGRKVKYQSGKVIEEIPNTEVKSFAVDPNVVVKSLHENTDWDAFSERDAIELSGALSSLDSFDLPNVVQYKREEINERGEPIIYTWEKGKRRAYRLADGEFGIELYNAITSANKEQASIFTKIASAPATLLRVGVTSTPEFMITNFIRDQISAWVLTDVGYIPGWDAASGIKSEVLQDTYSRLYRSHSGLSTQNVASTDLTKINDDIKSLKSKNIVVRRLKSWKGFTELTDLSETSTRIGLFKKHYLAAKKRGLSEKAALVEAAYEARDYIDFGRHGSKMLAARRAITFLNAALQGLDKTYRVMGPFNAPQRKALRKLIAPVLKDLNAMPLSESEQRELRKSRRAWVKVVSVGMLGASLSLLYKDDPEYEEIDKSYMRATHWFVKMYNEETGVSEWVAIPKPYELGIMSNAFETAIDEYGKEDPEWLDRFIASNFKLLAPPTSAPAASVPIELYANKRFFDGRPIVEATDLGKEPAYQFNEYTSDFSKRLGKAIGVSPAKIDHVITGYTGSWGRNVLALSNPTDEDAPALGLDDTPFARRMIKTSDRGGFSERTFWKEMNATEGGVLAKYNTFRDIADTEPADDSIEYLHSLDDFEKGFVLNRWLRVNRVEAAGLDADHPLEVGRKSAMIVSDYRDVVRDSEVISPGNKKKIDDVLDRLQSAYYRNALIAGKHPSYENRAGYPIGEYLTKLNQIEGQAGFELQRLFSAKNMEINPQRDYDLYQQVGAGYVPIWESLVVNRVKRFEFRR